MRRLVRVVSVRIDNDAPAGEQDEISDFLTSTIVLEAIYESQVTGER